MEVKRQDNEVVKMVQTTVIEKGVSINLNEEEAAALVAVLGKINGQTMKDNLRHVITSKLWESLVDEFGWRPGSYQGYPDIVKKYEKNIVRTMSIG